MCANLEHWKPAAPESIAPPGHWQVDLESRYGLPALDGADIPLQTAKLCWARFPPAYRDADDVDSGDIARFRNEQHPSAESQNQGPETPVAPAPDVRLVEIINTGKS